MEAKAIIKYLRIGPRKVRPILNVIRHKSVRFAFSTLAAMNKKGARYAEEALRSAVANAKVKKMDEEKLIIADFRADGGPMLKRFMARSMGRANRILKRTTHLSVIVVEKQIQKPALKKPEMKEEAASAPVKHKKTRAKKPVQTKTKKSSGKIKAKK